MLLPLFQLPLEVDDLVFSLCRLFEEAKTHLRSSFQLTSPTVYGPKSTSTVRFVKDCEDMRDGEAILRLAIAMLEPC